MIPEFDFSLALRLLKEGHKVTRTNWNGKGMWLEIQRPDAHSKMTRPYIFMTIPAFSSSQFGEEGAKDNRVPWLASQTDLLAEDWTTVD